MSKYSPLTRYLKAGKAVQVPMAFQEIEAVLGYDLPKSARKHRPWWSNENEGAHVQAQAWMNAGYQVTDVDMRNERLVFLRLNAVDEKECIPANHPLWGAMKGTVTFPPDIDLTEPLWDMEATEESMDELARMLAGNAG